MKSGKTFAFLMLVVLFLGAHGVVWAAPFSSTLFSFSTAGYGNSQPIGIAFNPNDGHLFVSDRSGYVFEFNSAGEMLRSFNTGFADQAEGITYDPITGDLLITNSTYAIAPGLGVYQFTTGGTMVGTGPIIKRDGSKLIGSDPDGVAVHPVTGNIWVVNQSEKTLQEFNRAGQKLRQFSTPGAILYPSDLTFDPITGNLYVSDDARGTKSIYVLNADGQIIDSFSTVPFGFTDPTGLEFDPTGTILYIASANPQVGALTNSVPEPGTLLLLGAGLLGLAGLGRRFKK